MLVIDNCCVCYCMSFSVLHVSTCYCSVFAGLSLSLLNFLIFLFYFKNKEQTFYINIFVFFVLYKLICVMLLCYFEGPIIYKYPLFNGSLHFHRKYQFCLYYVIQILFICSLSICKWYYSHVILLNFFVLMKYCYDFWFLWKWKI